MEDAGMEPTEHVKNKDTRQCKHSTPSTNMAVCDVSDGVGGRGTLFQLLDT